jgi:hypothetical protein
MYQVESWMHIHIYIYIYIYIFLNWGNIYRQENHLNQPSGKYRAILSKYALYSSKVICLPFASLTIAPIIFDRSMISWMNLSFLCSSVSFLCSSTSIARKCPHVIRVSDLQNKTITWCPWIAQPEESMRMYYKRKLSPSHEIQIVAGYSNPWASYQPSFLIHWDTKSWLNLKECCKI